MIRWKIITTNGQIKEGKEDGTNTSTLSDWVRCSDWLENLAEKIENVEINIGNEALSLGKHEAYYFAKSVVKIAGSGSFDTITVGYGDKKEVTISEYNQKTGELIKSGKLSFNSIASSIFLLQNPQNTTKINKKDKKNETKLDSTATV